MFQNTNKNYFTLIGNCKRFFTSRMHFLEYPLAKVKIHLYEKWQLRIEIKFRNLLNATLSQKISRKQMLKYLNYFRVYLFIFHYCLHPIDIFKKNLA